MRGWSHIGSGWGYGKKVFPAHAGVIPVSTISSINICRISRTCGGDPKNVDFSKTRTPYFPHMRGWSQGVVWWHSWILVFPAHAGVIPINKASFSLRAKYFPHMRGWSLLNRTQALVHEVFPAHAGVILALARILMNFPCISRTCGGDPNPRFLYSHLIKYFPHMRGWSFDEPMQKLPRKVFPAHAGVIPRMIIRVFVLYLYFPHMRGWSYIVSLFSSLVNVFPAHAGVILYDYTVEVENGCISRTCGGDP